MTLRSTYVRFALAGGAVAVCVLTSCDKAVMNVVGDAMTDVGGWISDAGGDGSTSDASAQTPTIIPITCTQGADRTTTTAATTITQHVDYEWVTVAEPRNVMVEKCGINATVNDTCSGTTCTGLLPVADCQLFAPKYTASQVLVECGSSTTVTPISGSPTTTAVTFSTVRLIVRP